MITNIVRLPNILDIGGVTNVKVYASEGAVIYENYSQRGGTDSMFHVYAIERQAAAEVLGQLIGSFSNLNAAIGATTSPQTSEQKRGVSWCRESRRSIKCNPARSWCAVFISNPSIMPELRLLPVQLPNESAAAFGVFKKFVAMGKARSIRAVARRCGINASLCSRWSAKHRWIERLRQLETESALQQNEAARIADQRAKEKSAEEFEAMRLRWRKRQLEVAEKMMARAEEILECPTKGNRPDDSAKLFAAANSIGNAALGIQGQDAPMQPIAPPVISLTIHRDQVSDHVERLQYEFLKEHPDHAQSKRLCQQYEREHGINGEEQ